MGLLRRLSSGVASSSETEEGDGTPTKRNGQEVEMLGPVSGERTFHLCLYSDDLLRKLNHTFPLVGTPSLVTPTPSPRLSTDKLPNPMSLGFGKGGADSAGGADESQLLAPRLSLPAFSLCKPSKRLNHRQSAPEYSAVQDEDVFERRFVIVEAFGKGAFSQVVKVKERDGEGVFAVKKARGVFDGVKDRYVS
jgi:hypothetical protein